MIEYDDFGAEFFEKYPRCFPERRVPRARRRWKERWLSWQWRRFRAFLKDMLLGPLLTRSPMCGAECGVGWWPILHRLFADLEVIAERVDGFGIAQVKQKGCGLRVYTSVHVPDADALIKRAEREAWVTCEGCGDSVDGKVPHWGINLCERCKGANL